MKILLKILKVVLRILLGLVIIAVGVFGVLTILEYRPAGIEEIPVVRISASEGAEASSMQEAVPTNEPLTIVSWNIGYGALGDNASFFMDGGDDVYTADKDRIWANLTGISDTLNAQDADFVLLQELDRKSSRSRSVNEEQFFNNTLIQSGMPGSAFDTSFAYNFNVLFVPFPIPPMGKVESGLYAASRYPVASAERISLPCPFSWPVRTANLKRCLLVNRLPVAGSDRELVLIDLHLEAYDNGEGKIAQTKKLISILKEERAKGNYVIAGGDFNQTFSSVDISAYPKDPSKWLPGIIPAGDFMIGTETHWGLLMDASVPTCRSLDQPYAGADLAHFQYYVIDGFIVSDNIEVNSFETLDEGFVDTDHNPVRLEFTLSE